MIFNSKNRDFQKKYFKMVYKQLYENLDLRGEWWIDDSGNAQFADGDIGDMGHGAMVIDHVTRTLLNIFDIDDDEPDQFKNYETQIKQYLIDETIISTNEQINAFDEDPEAFIFNYVKETHSNMFPYGEKQIKDALAVVGYSNIDARDYALVYWKWKRMKGNNIQTQHLTSEDLRIIQKGIDDALNSEGDLENIDPENIFFNIEVMATGHYYTDVPLSVIDEGNPQAIALY